MSFATALSEYLNLGLSPREARAFAANEGVETNFDSSAVNTSGGGQGAHGLLQHRGVRYDNLRRFAAERGKPHTDPSTNRAFNVWEYRNDPKNAWGGVDLPSLIRDAKSDHEGAKLFRQHYERPGEDKSGYSRLASYYTELPEGYEAFDPIKTEQDRQSLEGFSLNMDKMAGIYNNLSEFMLNEGAATEQEMLKFEQARTGTEPPKPVPSAAGAPRSQSPNVSGSGPAGEKSSSAPPPENWRTRLANALFPNHEDSSAAMGNALSALSLGLGQMSAGEAINLNPVMTRIAQRRRDNLYQQQQEADFGLRERQVALQEAKQRADYATARLDPAVANQMRASLPIMSPVIDMAEAGDRDAVKQVYKALSDLDSLDPVDSSELSAVADLLADPEVSDQRKIAAYAALPEASREILGDWHDYSTPDGSTKVKDLDGMTQYYMRPENGGLNRDDARAQAEQYLNSGSIGNLLANQIKQQEAAENVKEFAAHRERLNKSVADSGNRQTLLQDAIRSTIKIEEEGGVTGAATPLLSKAYSWLSSLGGDDAVQWLSTELKLDPKWVRQLEDDGMAFMYATAQELDMVGRGFTPEEAKMIMQISPSSVQDYDGRVRLLSRLQAAGDAAVVEQQIMTNPEVTVDNYQQVNANNSATFAMVEPIMSKVHDYAIRAQTKGHMEQLVADWIYDQGGNGDVAGTAYVKHMDDLLAAGTISEAEHEAGILNFESSLIRWKDVHMPVMTEAQWDLLSVLLPELVGYRKSGDRGLSRHMQLR